MHGARHINVDLEHQSVINHYRSLSGISPSKTKLLRQIYYTFSIGKLMIVYNNVPTFSEWSTNF